MSGRSFGVERPRLALLAALAAACTRPPSAAPAPAADVAAPLPAVCAPGSLGDTPLVFEPPPSVRRDPRDRAAIAADARGWTLPPEVTFALEGPPVREGSRVRLRGALRNAASAPRAVFLAAATGSYFYATLTGPAPRRRVAPAASEPGVTPPPAVFPETSRFEMAPGARWPFEVAIELSCWALRPGEPLTLHWWFGVEGATLQGDARLP